MVRVPYIKIPNVRVGSIDPTSDIGTGGATPVPPTPITYLTQWMIVGNSEVHGNEIWSCGEYSDVDNKYHAVILPTGKQAVDIVLNEPLRKTGNTADTLEYPTGTSGKALLTIRVEENDGELSPLDTPITELVDAPQIAEADSYTCFISQGAKAIGWSSFNGGILELYDKITPTDNAYIDTGYIPTMDSKFVAKVVTNSQAYCIYSNLRTQNDVDSAIRFFRSQNSMYIAFSGNRYPNQSSNHPTDIELEHSYTPKVTINNDSNTYITSTGSKFTSNTLYLFHDGYSPVYDYFNGNSLYSFKIYENDVLVRDFKPCTYNGVAGLWDMVESKFYSNSNNVGTLTASNDV